MGLTFEAFEIVVIDVDSWQFCQVQESCRFSVQKGNSWNLRWKMVWKKVRKCCLLNNPILSNFRTLIRILAAPMMTVLCLRIGRRLVLLIYNLELSLVDVIKS